VIHKSPGTVSEHSLRFEVIKTGLTDVGCDPVCTRVHSRHAAARINSELA
jgi:hypothetical protein